MKLTEDSRGVVLGATGATMPYYYVPNRLERMFNWFHLHRWCWRCQNWVWFAHVHRHRPGSGGLARLGR